MVGVSSKRPVLLVLPNFGYDLPLSRYYRAVSFAPQLAGDRARVREEMGIAERLAGSLEPTNERERGLKLENLHPLLESRVKEAFRLDELELAEARARELVEDVDPYDPGARIELGEVLIERGKMAEAAEVYVSAAHLGPRGTAIAWFMAGQCYEHLEDPLRACDCYLATHTADPLGISPLRRLASLAKRIGWLPLAEWAERSLDGLARRPEAAARGRVMPDHRDASQASASRWHAYVAAARGPLAALLACRLCTAIAFFGSVPFLVLRLSEDVGFPVSTATLLVGALTVAARVLAMPAGVLVDRVGHLQVITGSAFLAAVALLLLGLSAQPAVAVAGLGIYSIGAAAQYVAFNAVVPRFTEEARQPVAFALMGAMFNTGATARPGRGAGRAPATPAGRLRVRAVRGHLGAAPATHPRTVSLRRGPVRLLKRRRRLLHRPGTGGTARRARGGRAHDHVEPAGQVSVLRGRHRAAAGRVRRARGGAAHGGRARGRSADRPRHRLGSALGPRHRAAHRPACPRLPPWPGVWRGWPGTGGRHGAWLARLGGRAGAGRTRERALPDAVDHRGGGLRPADPRGVGSGAAQPLTQGRRARSAGSGLRRPPRRVTTDALTRQEQLMRQAHEQTALARLHRLLGRAPASSAAQPVGARRPGPAAAATRPRRPVRRPGGSTQARPLATNARFTALVENDAGVAELARRAEHEIGVFLPRVNDRECSRADLARLLRAPDPRSGGRPGTRTRRSAVVLLGALRACRAPGGARRRTGGRELAWLEACLEALEQQTREPYRGCWPSWLNAAG